MRINEHTVERVVLALGVVALAVVALTAYTTRSAEYDQQMELVKKYYSEYRSAPEGQRRPPINAYFSPELTQLLAARQQLCKKLSRNDIHCDYERDQASSPPLEAGSGFTFDKAGLMEMHAGNNSVDVLGKLLPEEETHTLNGLRYILVRQADGWRIDNVLYSEWGYFSADRSMRSEIKMNIDSLLYWAGNIQTVASEVFQKLKNKDTLTDAERYIKYPVQLCDKDGRCSTAKKEDPKVRQAITDWHTAYYERIEDDADSDPRFVTPDKTRVSYEPALEGKEVVLDGLTYTFQHQTWWISKIDLSKVLIPGARHAIQ